MSCQWKPHVYTRFSNLPHNFHSRNNLNQKGFAVWQCWSSFVVLVPFIQAGQHLVLYTGRSALGSLYRQVSTWFFIQASQHLVLYTGRSALGSYRQVSTWFFIQAGQHLVLYTGRSALGYCNQALSSQAISSLIFLLHHCS